METNNMKYIVYQTVNKVNGMLYVGVHKTPDPNKFDKYIGGGIYIGNSLKNPKTAYQYALKKYGYDNFVRSTLFVYNDEDSAYDKEAEIVDIAWVKSRNNYNCQTGGLRGIYRGKKLYQFSYKGILIKVWDSYKEAAEYFGTTPDRFCYAIKGKYSAFESYWAKTETINISEYRKAHMSEIFQFDTCGNFIKTWKSEMEIVRELKFNKYSVHDIVAHKKLFHNFYFIKDKDKIYDVILLNQMFNTRYRSIYVYNEQHELLYTFSSLKEATKVLKIDRHTIVNKIKSKECYKGLIFEDLANINRYCKVKQIDLNGNVIKIWSSLSQCAKAFPKCRDVLKGVRKQTKGYTFEYVL